MARFRPLRTTFVVLVAIVAIVAAGCSSSSRSSASSTSTTRPPSTGTTPAATTATTTVRGRPCGRPHTAGHFAQSFVFQGVSRTYQLYVPKVYAGTRNVPLVFDFHGFGSNALQQMVYGNFKPQADADDFLIVSPDGQVPAARHFNLTGEKGLQDDVQMVAALLDHIEATLCVDAHRVYSTGMSDGGAMTSVLACRMSDRFAAFGPVAVVVACASKKAVPIMAFAGTADPVVPFNGGKVNCCGGGHVAGAAPSMVTWATTDHCSTKYQDLQVSSEVTRRTWPGCAPGGSVTFYIVAGGGHTWPGSIPIASLGKTTKQIDASATLWRFFRAHALT